MSEPVMPDEARAEWYAEEERHIGAVVAFVRRWPNFRGHVAYALLGSAVATVDMMGGDVEGFIANLRKREPKPVPVEPPHGN